MLRIVAIALLIAMPAAAQEEGAGEAGTAPPGFSLGSSEFAFSSDLLAQGGEIVAASGAGGSVWGVRLEEDAYLCFLADVPDAQERRQEVIIGAMGDEAAPRELPSIPVVCILTQ
jgi:hypothetical protein